jgi:hypothetical protein
MLITSTHISSNSAKDKILFFIPLRQWIDYTSRPELRMEDDVYS